MKTITFSDRNCPVGTWVLKQKKSTTVSFEEKIQLLMVELVAQVEEG